jgi:hypothetical protein
MADLTVHDRMNFAAAQRVFSSLVHTAAAEVLAGAALPPDVCERARKTLHFLGVVGSGVMSA